MFQCFIETKCMPWVFLCGVYAIYAILCLLSIDSLNICMKKFDAKEKTFFDNSFLK